MVYLQIYSLEFAKIDSFSLRSHSNRRVFVNSAEIPGGVSVLLIVRFDSIIKSFHAHVRVDVKILQNERFGENHFPAITRDLHKHQLVRCSHRVSEKPFSIRTAPCFFQGAIADKFLFGHDHYLF